jgi:hypothetical protein
LEGYWPVPFVWLNVLLTKWQRKRISRWEKRWQILEHQRNQGDLSLKEKRKYAILERKLHYMPSNPEDYMPTRLGNIIRMAETQPKHKYGLDAVVCWPRLWLVLPEDPRKQLNQVNESLNKPVELWTWGVLFLLWAPKSWWALPIGLLWAWIAYQLTLNSAMAYADLIEATFDTYRWELYHSLHLELPKNEAEEPDLGKKINTYLWRGQTKEGLQFKHPE